MKIKVLLVVLVVGQFAFNCWVAWRIGGFHEVTAAQAVAVVKAMQHEEENIPDGFEVWTVTISANGFLYRKAHRSLRMDVFDPEKGWMTIMNPLGDFSQSTEPFEKWDEKVVLSLWEERR